MTKLYLSLFNSYYYIVHIILRQTQTNNTLIAVAIIRRYTLSDIYWVSPPRNKSQLGVKDLMQIQANNCSYLSKIRFDRAFIAVSFIQDTYVVDLAAYQKKIL